MALLKDVENDQGSAKIGIFGDTASGKTVTAGLLAIGFAKEFGNGKPVAMFDTEHQSSFLRPLFRKEGIPLKVFHGRAFKLLIEVFKEAEDGGYCAFIVDSITHTWVDIVDSYCAKKKISRPEFQHWRDIKQEWQKWPDSFLNSPMHCVVNGRSGFEYEYQETEEKRPDGSFKKELIKGDTKMRVEGQFGYEPHLLVEMERVRDTQGEHIGGIFIHRAHILKDRSWALNGLHFDFPDQTKYAAGYWKRVFDVFRPHFDSLNLGNHKPVEAGDSQELFANGHSEYYRREQEKKIAIEEIEASFQLLWPGRDSSTTQIKIRVMEAIWGVRSKVAVETMPLEQIQHGLKVLREFEKQSKQAEAIETESGLLNLLTASIEAIKNPLPPKDGTLHIVKETAGLNLPPIPASQKLPLHDEELEEIGISRRNGSLILAGSGTFRMKATLKNVYGGEYDRVRKAWTIDSKYEEGLRGVCKALGIDVVEAVSAGA